ncbi:MAG TPA: energy transducer TonB [Lacibacter sp.]|nr:energy transducer TonB [Lacibacter sp.]
MKKIFTVLFVLISTIVLAQKKDSVTSIPVTKGDTLIFVKVDVEASFPGGENAWNEYIRSAIEKNIKKIMRNKPSVGTCDVQFIVDKDGSTSNVEALTLKNSVLAEIFTDAIRKGPKWNPASIDGKPVKAWRRQKVTFRAPD